ncbi:hypothetical protein CEUSTIGMA_g12139.t1 [Chlamydomonas eustigma]|uniref:Aminopeptidase P N-terminal domain-containing protein n=1 Tax=Chlamydomonas eustigma TaxID=1157962 RepID=A0A250XNR2_9CHLO|nr:hypothetical protein CEUSTIGMA_g12139.t1 [Chlamydomonas eustigma]|eukprot:GAX84717.1 hypothetical protein CEUSTIGMA_g12139.t1 [Chlamydomonas eustigma]
MHKLYARGVHPTTSWRNDAVVRSGATANAPAARHFFNSMNIRDQTKLIRERLLKEHLSGGLVYLESGEELLRNGSDVFHTFRADSNFLYVSGINFPGFACILDMESGTFTLLAPRLPPEAAFWMGGLPSLDELASEYGADRCAYKDELPVLLKRVHEMKGRTIHTTNTLASRVQNVIDDTKLQSNDSAMLTSSGRTASSLTIGTAPHGGDVASSNDSSTISSSSRVIGGLLESTLARCRAIKTEAEVACLLEANIASGQAHKAIWRACHPGLMEYQLEAEFRRTAAYSGCLHVGYPSIVGSGRNLLLDLVGTCYWIW